MSIIRYNLVNNQIMHEHNLVMLEHIKHNNIKHEHNLVLRLHSLFLEHLKQIYPLRYAQSSGLFFLLKWFVKNVDMKHYFREELQPKLTLCVW